VAREKYLPDQLFREDASISVHVSTLRHSRHKHKPYG